MINCASLAIVVIDSLANCMTLDPGGICVEDRHSWFLCILFLSIFIFKNKTNLNTLTFNSPSSLSFLSWQIGLGLVEAFVLELDSAFLAISRHLSLFVDCLPQSNTGCLVADLTYSAQGIGDLPRDLIPSSFPCTDFVTTG